ncbi:MAG: regulatory protein RecX [Bacteroidales bacterium]|nr:regulatory protein RecX [Bacteroidales bacterium]
MNRTPRKPLSPEAAFNKAATLCARAEQATGDIYTKLQGWGLSVDDAQGVIQRLKSENYLNDERYARAYCRDKMRFNGWGRIKVAFMLKSKGIGKIDIETVLAEVDENEYLSTLQRLLQAKWRDVKAKEPMQARASLMRFAASRGFEPAVFYPAIDQVMNEENQD